MVATSPRSRLFEFLEKWSPGMIEAVRVLKNGQIEWFPPRRTYALPLLHRYVKNVLSLRRGGYFVEVGANNGILQSNTAYLERYCGWRGLLIEAIPHKFVECARNRPNSAVEHCALVSSAFEGDFVELEFNDLMTRVRSADSGEALDAHQGLVGTDLRISGTRFLAPARTLDEVLIQHGDPVVDFFSLDVEGFELEVLAGVSLEERRIDRFLIETSRFEDVSALLQSHGYRFVSKLTAHDYLFERSPDWSAPGDTIGAQSS